MYPKLHPSALQNVIDTLHGTRSVLTPEASVRTIGIMRSRFLFLLLCILASTGLCAEGPAFDLVGPKVDVHVKRGDLTLPISQTPNLLPGDRLWIHPDLPDSQSTQIGRAHV